jgi:hypothetical protein
VTCTAVLLYCEFKRGSSCQHPSVMPAVQFLQGTAQPQSTITHQQHHQPLASSVRPGTHRVSGIIPNFSVVS